MLIGLTSIFLSSLNRAINLASATSSPKGAVKSPLPHLVASRAAFTAQSLSDVAKRALLRCHGVICCSPPEVYLFASLAALRMSSLLTDIEGKLALVVGSIGGSLEW